MKKKITFLSLVFMTSVLIAQNNWTTGTVNLDTDYNVKFDIDISADTVTMTMVGPDNVWLGVAPGIMTGLGMGNADDEAITYNANGGASLEDRNMPAGTSLPNLDNNASPADEWTLVSNVASGGIVRVIATRAIDTGDSEDFVFPTSAQPLPILWAHGIGTNFEWHRGNRGGVVANIVLSNGTEFELQTGLSIYPNPAQDNLNINISKLMDNSLNLEVYDVIGNKILEDNITSLSSQISVSEWNSGVYILKLSSKKTKSFVTKRFVKL